MTFSELINKGAELLKKNPDISGVRFESELLLSFVLKKERLYLLLHESEEAGELASALFFSYIERRAAGEPFSYITKTKEFMSLEFCVESGVLIPRPDTETLVCHIIDCAGDGNVNILDLCTGSGAVAVSLAKYIKNAVVDAVDICDTCIRLAKINAEKNGVADSVNVIKADVLKGIATTKKYDFIVSNPPYIKTDTLPTLMSGVRDFEPHLALDGGADGLVFYRAISSLAPSLLTSGGMLAFEVGHDQSEAVKSILSSNGFKDIIFKKDLAQTERVVSGIKA